jgi:hypothetical protein
LGEPACLPSFLAGAVAVFFSSEFSFRNYYGLILILQPVFLNAGFDFKTFYNPL